MASHWPPSQPEIQLVPLLIRKAQAAFWGLDDMVAQDYKQVKAAILDRLDIEEET